MKKTILIFGSPGSFAHEAALTHLPADTFHYAQNISEIFLKIENDSIEFGLIPLCNSQSGFVRETFEQLQKYQYQMESLYRFDPQKMPTGKNAETLKFFKQKNKKIIDFFSFPIEQNLLILPATQLKNIKKIASHPQALWQCDQYLYKKFPSAQRVEWADTATAARDLAQGILNPDTAVIASAEAAKLYGLKILKRNIENKSLHGRDVTTFLLLRAKSAHIPGTHSLPAKPPTFGIIGYGRFGKLWAECLQPYGSVYVYDKKIKPASHYELPATIKFVSLTEAAKVDFLFLLVPIHQIEACCRQLAPLLSQETFVIDACSVKEYPVRMMLRSLPPNQPLIATHPLFGPDSVRRLGLSGRKIVVHSLRCPKKKFQIFERILHQLKLEIIHAPPREHDQKMAQSQALVHFLGRAFANLKLQNEIISTPDYQSLVRINDLVQNDTHELFYGMQNYNRFAAPMRKKLMAALAKTERNISRHSIKNSKKSLSSSTPTLSELRHHIDEIDQKIIHLIADRLAIAKKIGAYKRNHHAEIFDEIREKKLKKLHRHISKTLKLNPAFTQSVFDSIFKESKKLQKKS